MEVDNTYLSPVQACRVPQITVIYLLLEMMMWLCVQCWVKWWERKRGREINIFVFFFIFLPLFNKRQQCWKYNNNKYNARRNFSEHMLCVQLIENWITGKIHSDRINSTKKKNIFGNKIFNNFFHYVVLIVF